MFTQRHYTYLAEKISKLSKERREFMAAYLASVFAQDNPRFKHGAWYDACGVKYEEK